MIITNNEKNRSRHLPKTGKKNLYSVKASLFFFKSNSNNNSSVYLKGSKIVISHAKITEMFSISSVPRRKQDNALQSDQYGFLFPW